MNHSSKVLSLVLSMVLMVAGPAFSNGLPFGSQAGSLEDVVKSSSTLEERFEIWSEVYHEVNGDRNVVVPVYSSRILSTMKSQGRGLVTLDLVGGHVKAELQGFDFPADIYAVDYQPDTAALPKVGDTMLFLGTVNVGETLDRDLGEHFFEGFLLDNVFVTQKGASPVDSRVLMGGTSLFQRIYNRARVEAVEGLDAKTGAGQSLVNKGLVGQQVFDGGDIFFRETFDGNGRSCGTCHPPENNLVVDPAFIQDLAASGQCDFNNPNNTGVCGIFVAETRNDSISNLEKPDLMRNFGLILENVDGFEDPGVKFMMRSVPHTLSMAVSIQPPLDPNGVPLDGADPNFAERTGWSGDGSPVPGDLRNFVQGAIFQHYPDVSFDNRAFGTDFRMATPSELDAVDAFLQTTGRVSEVDLPTMSLTNATADFARSVFIGTACNFCHNQASAISIFRDGNRNFDTGVERLVNPAQGFNGINFPLDCGNSGQNLANPDFDVDGDGVNDCFGNGTFNVPTLIESADTGPFFHNNVGVGPGLTTNTSTAIEAAIRFYNTDEFNLSPAGIFFTNLDADGDGQPDGLAPINLTEPQIAAVGGFLRVLNAAFNYQISEQRDEAAFKLTPFFGTGDRATVDKLLSLSNDELIDALGVLKDGPLGNLNPDSTFFAEAAIIFNLLAIDSNIGFVRQAFIAIADELIEEAFADLGTGLEMQMGEGNLLF